MDQGYIYKDCCHPGSVYPQSRNNLPPQSHHQQLHQSPAHNHPKQSISAREDFTGLDNDALDFSQLEDFIANEADANGSYFADTLANSEASKHTTGQPGQPLRDRILLVTSVPVPSADGSIQYVGGKLCPPTANTVRSTVYAHGALPHNLPDSPPDSGSEPPYSPTDPGSRSPNHKASNINGRRNLHDLLLNPMYPQNPGGPGSSILPLLQHDMPPIGSPISHITSSHVPPLIPISPSSANPGGSPSTNATLTSLDGSQSISSQSISIDTSDPNLVPPSQPPPSQVLQNSQDDVVPFYTLQNVPPETSRGRKRKSSDSTTLSNSKIGPVQVKQEPEMSPADSNSSNNNSNCNGSGNADDEYFDLSGDPSMYMDPNYQCIKFQSFQENTWHTLTDEAFKELPPTYFKVDADKGFNFSNADDAFVCQKKNHFQITCHVKLQGDAKYVKAPDGYKHVENFYIHFYGVKAESPNQTIKIEQSQSDRSKKPFHPVPLEMNTDNVGKLTVGRLHFNETTSNNMRKKGKPNPDQRYFYLVVALHAHCTDGGYPIMAHSSQRIIVRASNPGQFESDMELSWQKGNTSDSIYHAGRVGINTDRPEEALVVYGNCKITGQIIHPSDMRAKENIREMDSKEQLKNVQQLRVVRYKYNPEFARLVGLSEEDAEDTGMIAQEVQRVIPDAVKETGDIELPNGQMINNFLVVNKERIFMENIGAVKELCKVTGKLETRIDNLEKITQVHRTGGDSFNLPSTSSSPRKITSGKESRRHTTEFICSNKCVQLLIVFLVLVMAFCLVAMATLYMLEYHKRSSYDFYHHGSHHLYNTSHDFLIPQSPQYRPRAYGNSGLPTYPNPSTFFPDSMHSHSSNQPTKYPKVPVKHLNSAKTPEHFNPHPVLKPKILGRPTHCFPTLPYQEPSCGTFCCAGSNMQGSASEYLDIERKNHVALGPVATSRFFPISSTAPPPNNHTEDAISVVFSSNPVHRNGLDSKRRKRRQINESPKLITVPSIHILSLNINQSLDASYCMMNSDGYHDCVSTENRYFSSANLTYHVPLSKYWDEMNVSLIFNFSSRFDISRPQICHKVYVQPYCQLDEGNPNVNASNLRNKPGASNAFPINLQVGSSPYSRFNIRFSSNVEDQDKLCTLTKDVFEFNFHFYRVCQE